MNLARENFYPTASEIPNHDLVDRQDAFFPNLPPLNIELSSRCNLKCPYCANPTLKREHENLPDEIFEKVVSEARAMGAKIIGLHGVGEPLLRRDLERILRRLDATGVWSKWITTNGALLTATRMKSLYEAGLRGIYNSLDTLDPDLYARTRGGKLDKAVSNVTAAAAAYPDVHIMVGLMNHKEQVVDEIIKAKFKSIYGHLSNVSLHVYENGRFPGAGEDWTRWGSSGFKVETCFAPASYFTIDAKGNAALCCADQNTEYSLGNVADKSLSEIWFDRENQNMFRQIALGLSGCPAVCYKCIMKPSQRKLEDVEPVLYGRFEELLRASRARHMTGDIEAAKRYMDFALLRDPLNEQVKRELSELEALTGSSDRGYFQKFRDGGL